MAFHRPKTSYPPLTALSSILLPLLVILIGSTTFTSAASVRRLQCECFTAGQNSTKSCRGPSVQCKKTESCYAAWATDQRSGEVVVSAKGCIDWSRRICDQPECLDRSEQTRMGYNFCCCNGNMCNSQPRWVFSAIANNSSSSKPPTSADHIAIVDHKDEPSESWLELSLLGISLWSWSLVAILVTLFLVAVYYYYLCRGRKPVPQFATNKRTEELDVEICKPKLDGEAEKSWSLTPPDPAPPELISIKAQGRYGRVWRAKFQGVEVAVKVFQPANQKSWHMEKDIFRLPQMNHPNVLQFIGTVRPSGAELYLQQPQPEQTKQQALLHFHLQHADPAADFWLMTAFHPHGSLGDYLSHNTLDWWQLCRIAESMARGLSYLHEELPATATEPAKPTVVHRDFKSCNVLLKSDWSACVADFGLALVFEQGRWRGNATMQVGTMRYMAPELLDGAIDFTRNAFLQTDMYAYGLVLWELVSRCTAHGGVVGEHQTPFQAEVGRDSGLKKMREIVFTQKMRPKIEDEWLKHSGLASICETIEMCWADDADSRLSATCVVDQIAALTDGHQS